MGGPSRPFLVVALAASVVSAALLLRDGRLWEGGVVGAAAVYFGLRLGGIIGRRRD